MKKKLPLLFSFCCLLCSTLTLNANSADPLNASMSPTTCELPAPANLQHTHPDSYSVQFTWDPVPGAVGYRGVLKNLHTGTQTENTDVSPNFLYPAIPGNSYEFFVAALCTLDPISASNDTSQLRFVAPAIIIEVTLKNSGEDCTPASTSILLSTDSQKTWLYDWGDGQYYCFELGKITPPPPPEKGGGPGLGTVQLVRFSFKYDEDSNKYFVKEFSNNEEVSELCGFEFSLPFNCASSGQAVHIKFTFNGRTCRITFPDIDELHYWVDGGDTAFDTFKIYECAGSGERSDQNSAPPSTMPPLQVAAASPFSEQLSLYFIETLEGNVTMRLFDLQGDIRLERLFETQQLVEGVWAVPTEDLPAGMYFLNMESSTGQFVTQKVVKF